ncbi:MAG: trypsin-like serine protease [Myxococcota bacterium]
MSPSVITFASLMALGDPSWQPPRDPSLVIDGTIATACQWPTVVATVVDPAFPSLGTGSLVHPRVVVYSAHSGTSFDHIFVGEDIYGEGRQASIERCVAHPDWDGMIQEGDDIAYCLLSESVDDVPIIPILMGCEVEQNLVDGLALHQVGFGMYTEGSPPDGQKRWVSNGRLVGGDALELMVENPGRGGVGVGDSGGPLLIPVADGSWRVFGVLSWGQGEMSAYIPIHHHMAWLEGELAAEGIDLSPCHDSDGRWNPSDECTMFPLDPDVGGGRWATGCEPGALSGPSATCGEPGGSDETGTSSSDSSGGEPGGGETSTTASHDGTTTAVAGTSRGGVEEPDRTTGVGGDSNTDTGGGGIPATDGDQGCGCRGPQAPIGDAMLVWIWSGLIVLQRRRASRG